MWRNKKKHIKIKEGKVKKSKVIRKGSEIKTFILNKINKRREP